MTAVERYVHSSIQSGQRRKAAFFFALFVWAGATGFGLYAMSAHGAVSGKGVTAPDSAPKSVSSAVRTSGRATLVMVAHPACPCTRASLHELTRIVSSNNTKAVDVVILFAGSKSLRDDRVARDLRDLASAVPNARVVDDFGGVIAKELGAHTSGSVVFYDATGRLRFSGGVTSSRGHEGDSAGGDTVRGLMREAAQHQALSVTTPSTSSPSSSPTNAAVYGCALEDRSK